MKPPIRPFEYRSRVGDDPELALITRADVVQACTWKPDESDAVKYPAFETALDAVLDDPAARADVQDFLYEAVTELAEKIKERMERDDN